MRCTKLVLLFCVLAATTNVAAAALPQAPSPPAPFPTIRSIAFSSDFVAPGIFYAEYAMQTKDGPLEIHVVDADLHEPSVRIDAVLANDVLVSPGETPTSMAARTGAVAGINADYFDIGNTNEPLGVVVRGGTLVRTPNAHSAFALTRDRRVLMAPFALSGTAQIGTIPIALSGMNEWPPHDGVSLVTPAHGPLAAAPGLSAARLTPLDVDGAAVARYRIEEVVRADQPLAKGYWLAISAGAAQILGTPAAGDVVTLSETSQTGFANFAAAVGGGPLLIQSGARYYEANAPAANEGRSRIPISAAALRADGTLMLVEVDGREPLHSIGLTRDELSSFLLSIGAVEAISFDGGGSSAIVARKLGDRNASLRNAPSDGNERAVGDGLFVYSDAPFGAAARLTAYPQTIRAFPGARVPIAFVTTDAAGHPAAAPSEPLHARLRPQALGATGNGTEFTALKSGNGTLHANRGALSTDIPVEIVQNPARIEIVPQHANLHAGGTQRFEAQAFDRAGFRIALPEHLHWTASSGRITDAGAFTATNDNATIAVALAGSGARQTVTVGEHEEPLQIGTQWRLTTVPAGGPGDLAFGVPCPECIQLSYDFSDAERDASMLGNRMLPEAAIGLRFDVEGDGNGEVLRISLLNAINERVYLTAGRVTWKGWQTKEIRFPASLAAPAQLRAVYVINGFGGDRVRAAGSIAIRNVRVILAGK